MFERSVDAVDKVAVDVDALLYDEEGVRIENSFLMPNTVIEKNSVVKYAIIGEDTVIHANAKIGDDPEFYPKASWGITVVGKGRTVEQNAILAPKEIY